MHVSYGKCNNSSSFFSRHARCRGCPLSIELSFVGVASIQVGVDVKWRWVGYSTRLLRVHSSVLQLVSEFQILLVSHGRDDGYQVEEPFR